MDVELVRDPSRSGYVTRDGRWRVRHEKNYSCAPKRWWWITDTTSTWRECAVPTLNDVRQLIAESLAVEKESI
jgi:hypothetical protein